MSVSQRTAEVRFAKVRRRVLTNIAVACLAVGVAFAVALVCQAVGR